MHFYTFNYRGGTRKKKVNFILLIIGGYSLHRNSKIFQSLKIQIAQSTGNSSIFQSQNIQTTQSTVRESFKIYKVKIFKLLRIWWDLQIFQSQIFKLLIALRNTFQGQKNQTFHRTGKYFSKSKKSKLLRVLGNSKIFQSQKIRTAQNIGESKWYFKVKQFKLLTGWKDIF